MGDHNNVKENDDVPQLIPMRSVIDVIAAVLDLFACSNCLLSSGNYQRIRGVVYQESKVCVNGLKRL